MAAETVSFTSPLRQTIRSCSYHQRVQLKQEEWKSREMYLEQF